MKHVRETLKAIKNLDATICVEVLRQRRHIVLCLSRESGQRKHITMSVSPKNAHYVVDNVLADVRKYFLEKT